MIERSRTPVSASCKVRGIGVAVSVRTWTSARSDFSFSLCATPKCCSSSTTTRPRSLNFTFLPSSAWVPTTISIEPSAMPFLTRFNSALVTSRDACADLDRETAEALGEGLGVLAREQRGRHHDRDLLAVHHRVEGRAQRHLGLAEADVAADQPVHRAAGGEIVERRVDRGLLVFGLLIGKAGGEFVVGAGRDGQLRRLAQLAFGGDLDQLVGDLADAVLQPRLARLPAGAAEPVELDAGVLGAVARQQLDVLHRQVELGAAGVVDFEAIVRRARRLDRSASRRSGRCRDRRAPRDRRSTRLVASAMKFSARLAARRGRTRRSPRMSCSLTTRRPRSRNRIRARAPRARCPSACRPAPPARSPLEQRLSSPWSASTCFMRSREPSLHSAITTRLSSARSACTCLTTASNTLAFCSVRSAAKLRPVRAPMSMIDPPSVRHRKRREPRHRHGAQPLAPFVFGEIQPVRRQRRVGRAHVLRERLLAGLVIVGDLREPLARRLLVERLQDHRRAGHVVEQRVELVVEQRQPVLHAGMPAAFAHRLVEQVVADRRRRRPRHSRCGTCGSCRW